MIYTDLAFLEGVKTPCEICHGHRFKAGDKLIIFKVDERSVGLFWIQFSYAYSNENREIVLKRMAPPERTDWTQVTEELIMAVESYIDRHNLSPKAFIWTASANDILQKATRARQALHNTRSASRTTQDCVRWFNG